MGTARSALAPSFFCWGGVERSGVSARLVVGLFVFCLGLSCVCCGWRSSSAGCAPARVVVVAFWAWESGGEIAPQRYDQFACRAMMAMRLMRLWIGGARGTATCCGDDADSQASSTDGRAVAALLMLFAVDAPLRMGGRHRNSCDCGIAEFVKQLVRSVVAMRRALERCARAFGLRDAAPTGAAAQRRCAPSRVWL